MVQLIEMLCKIKTHARHRQLRRSRQTGDYLDDSAAHRKSPPGFVLVVVVVVECLGKQVNVNINVFCRPLTVPHSRHRIDFNCELFRGSLSENLRPIETTNRMSCLSGWLTLNVKGGSDRPPPPHVILIPRKRTKIARNS